MLKRWRRGLTVFYVVIGVAMVAAAIVLTLRTAGQSGPLALRDLLLAVAVIQAVSTRWLIRQRFRHRWWRRLPVGIVLMVGVVLAWKLAVDPAPRAVAMEQIIAVILYLTSLAYLVVAILPWDDEVGAQRRTRGREPTGKK